MDNTPFEVTLNPEDEFSVEYSKPLLVGPDGSAALTTFGAEYLSGARVRVEVHLSMPAWPGRPPVNDGWWGTFWEFTYGSGKLPQFFTRDLVPGSWVRASVQYLAKDQENVVKLKMALRTNPPAWAYVGNHNGAFLSTVIDKKDIVTGRTFTTQSVLVGQDGRAALTTTDFHHINQFDITFQKNLSLNPEGGPNEQGWAPIPDMYHQGVTAETPAIFMAKDLIPGTRVRAYVGDIQNVSSDFSVRVTLRTHFGSA